MLVVIFYRAVIHDVHLLQSCFIMQTEEKEKQTKAKEQFLHIDTNAAVHTSSLFKKTCHERADGCAQVLC